MARFLLDPFERTEHWPGGDLATSSGRAFRTEERRSTGSEGVVARVPAIESDGRDVRYSQ